MISFQRKYCDTLFPFSFSFSHFGEISQLGTPKKKKRCCPQVGVLSSSPTKWFCPLLLIWTSQAPKLRAVLLVDRTHHQVGLYASLLIWTFSRSSCEEGASERASEQAKQTHSRDVRREEPVQGWCVERLLLPQSVCWSAPLRL
jgi:hypothetical protein